MISKGRFSINIPENNQWIAFKLTSFVKGIGLKCENEDYKVDIIFDEFNGAIADIDDIIEYLSMYFKDEHLKGSGRVNYDKGTYILENGNIEFYDSEEIVIRDSYDELLLDELNRRGYEIYKDGIKY